MEDIDNLVFHNEPSQQIFYKCLLSEKETLDLRGLIECNTHTTTNIGGLATGERKRTEISMDGNGMMDLKERIMTSLRDYFPDIQLGMTIRMYQQTFGGIKPHRDASLDGVSSYTLLLYMSDDFEGGKLSLKLKRTDQEKASSESSKHHKVFTFTPKIGYGLIFKKDILHWADEVVEGNKFIMLIDIISNF